MRAEVIVFDKDGTLIDFNAFWIKISVYAIKDILRELGREDIPYEKILSVLGVENGEADIDGILCKGTYEQMGLAVHNILKEYRCDVLPEDVIQMVIEAYNKNADKGEIKPTCENIREVLERLKNDGKKLLVVTTDNSEITHKCLEKLGIQEFFDKVYTDDGKTPVKPDPYCILEYCRLNDIDKDKIVMVGDTMTDIQFARNAGISVIGVGASGKNRDKLSDCADAVVSDISYISSVLKGDMLQ